MNQMRQDVADRVSAIVKLAIAGKLPPKLVRTQIGQVQKSCRHPVVVKRICADCGAPR